MSRGLIPVSEYAADPTHASSALDPARRRWYAERLEEGHILLFARAPFPLPDAGERAALSSARQASAAYHKNISYRPGEDRVKGLARGGDGAVVQRVLRRCVLWRWCGRLGEGAVDDVAPDAAYQRHVVSSSRCLAGETVKLNIIPLSWCSAM